MKKAFLGMGVCVLIAWPALLIAHCGAVQISAYKATSDACHAVERGIIARPVATTTRERDTNDIAGVRAVCDALLTRIESEHGK